MRGKDRQVGQFFAYFSPDALVPADHPLRLIRAQVNAALDRLSPVFDQLYSGAGRPSIAPEKLLRALLVQAFFSVRSERQLIQLRRSAIDRRTTRHPGYALSLRLRQRIDL